MPDSIREQLRALRKRRGLSTRRLAAAVGLSHGQISHIEGGRSETTLSMLERLTGEMGARVVIIEGGRAPLLAAVGGMPEGDAEMIAGLARALPKMEPATRAALAAMVGSYDED